MTSLDEKLREIAVKHGRVAGDYGTELDRRYRMLRALREAAALGAREQREACAAGWAPGIGASIAEMILKIPLVTDLPAAPPAPGKEGGER